MLKVGDVYQCTSKDLVYTCFGDIVKITTIEKDLIWYFNKNLNDELNSHTSYFLSYFKKINTLSDKLKALNELIK